MCGISAVIETQRPGPDAGQVLARMHAALTHRGPDGEGLLWIDPSGEASARREWAMPPEAVRAAAAFRWLRIQDLDARSSQPLESADGRAWILFNGEIYNHRSLREELEPRGERFRTRSDTEVALAAYRRWGTDAFARFDGMWGLVIFDLDRRRLVLCRDRLGIKPLYYAFAGTRLLVASEPQAIATSGALECRMQPFRVHEFLRGLPPQSAALSFFEGVHPLPAGTWAAVPLDGTPSASLAPQAFWSLADVRPVQMPESAFEATRAEFEARLDSAVRDHAQAAVEVGSLLSGGLDTSMLAHFLAAHARARGAPPPKAFSIVYEDPAMSEWPYVQLVLAGRHLRGFNHVLTPEEAWESAEAVVRAQGEPLLGQDTIAQYHAYALASGNGCRVVLDGGGADEILAGLPGYDAQQFPEMLRSGRWLRLVRELHARKRRYDLAWGEAIATYLRSPMALRRMQDRGLPRYAWLDSRVDSSARGPGRTEDCGNAPGALTRFLFRHTRHANLPAALMHQDRGSMAHGVESRVPFLDHRLVELAFRLPDRFKVHMGARKRILLETARRHLPAAIVERRDKRMFVSRAGWLDLRRRAPQALRAMAGSAELAGCGIVRPGEAAGFVEGFLAGRHADERAVWRLYTFWLWLRAFGPRG